MDWLDLVNAIDAVVDGLKLYLGAKEKVQSLEIFG